MNNGEFASPDLPGHPRCDVTYTAFHCVLMGKVYCCDSVTVCYFRLCVVLLVGGSPAYNDSRADTFRRLAREGIEIQHTTVTFAYIDTSKQADFLAKFESQPVNLRSCPDGNIATPVSVA